eukprot:COSAG05_NODE_2567_length_2889_cov_1.497491_2_plen_69_part_00
MMSSRLSRLSALTVWVLYGSSGVDNTGQFLITANYGHVGQHPGTISLLPISANDGSLGPATECACAQP